MSLSNLLIDILGPKVIQNILKRQKSEQLGREVAQVIDKVLDDTFGIRKSEKIERVLAPFISRFMIGFTEELLKDLPKQ